MMKESNFILEHPVECAALLLNIIALALYGVDKLFAKAHAWRIPEKVLIASCVPFSAAGGLLGMYLFHHKTRKPKFTITVPLLLLVQIAVALWYYGVIKF